MTLVRIDLRDPDGSGASGQVEWRPSRRLTTPEAVVLPGRFVVTLDGAPVTVEVAPTDGPTTGGAWAWRVTELVPGGDQRHLLVPTTSEVLAYSSLVAVDPATLTPDVEPAPAWDARVDALESRVRSVEGATGIAPTFLRHVQATPAASWPIVNPLGREPDVALYIDGQAADTDVTVSPDAGTVVLTFAEPTAGVAILT